MAQNSNTLPVLSVQFAFGSGVTTAPGSMTWYELGTQVKDLSTRGGRQHQLDRTEASTISLTLDNRDGRFFPWNSTSFTWNLAAGGTASLVPSVVLQIGVPYKVVATWNGTTYPVAYGFVDSWEPSSPDEVNSECVVIGTDYLKHLSLARLSNALLYPGVASGHWNTGSLPTVGFPDLWRCNDIGSTARWTKLANTGAAAVLGYGSAGLTLGPTSNATITVYGNSKAAARAWLNSSNAFTYVRGGAKYTVSYTSYSIGLGTVTLTGCCCPSTTFTTAVGDYIAGGTATATVFSNTDDSQAYQKQGVQVYDPSAGGIDLTNGTNAPALMIGTGYGAYSQVTSSPLGYTAEGWFKSPSAGGGGITLTGGSTSVTGDALVSIVLSTADNTSGYLTQWFLNVDLNGQVRLVRRQLTASAATDAVVVANSVGPVVNDGNWHLVTLAAFVGTTTNTLMFFFYVDGILCGTQTTGAAYTGITPAASWGTLLNGTNAASVPYAASKATVSDLCFAHDEMPIVSGHPGAPPIFATYSAIRYTIGSLLRSPTAVTYAKSTPTLTPTSAATLTVNSTQGFNPNGGLAWVSANQYPIVYTGTTSTTLTGVSLTNAATVNSYAVVSSNANADSVWSTQPKTTGIKLMEVAIIAGVIPADGLQTLTSSPISYAVGTVPCADETTTTWNTTALDYGSQLVETENGFFFQDPSGTLKFLDRFYPQTHAQTSTQISDANDSNAHYMLGVETPKDDLDLWTIAQLTNTTGTTTFVPDPTGTSLAANGQRTYARGQMWGARQQDVNALGYMIVARYANSITRPRKMTLSATYFGPGNIQPNQPIMFGSGLWDQFVFNHTGYGTNYAQTAVLEFISHVFKADPGTWETDFILSPYEMNGSSTANSGSFFRLGSSTFGVVQSSTTSVVALTTSSAAAVPLSSIRDLINTPSIATSGSIYLSGAAVPFTASGIPNTTTTSVVALTQSSSVSIVLASPTGWPASGSAVIVHAGIPYSITYSGKSGSTLSGCAIASNTYPTAVTTQSGDAIFFQGLYGVNLVSGSDSTVVGNRVYFNNVAQDQFGG